ncbi:TPA: hypothetical protein ACXDAY_002086 [Clostridium botulinum]|uniref:hypothetical protein n=1 Tax=Clostridium botulinum TaxID=1491 RepID=UPI00046340C0|nr:hypothetical protein [Clostridium botulinum]APR02394.1 hypothetical protein RSJ2_4103 [Clostridium botulinum]AUN01611.1 hypothetical protein RSJ19_01135 [Clostridium botulinum]MBN3359331.1 hypothetical protein [Clostridium botulinum]MBN3367160.1 hypothetical protein [Clostridium botulinum]MBN3376603.1 hypothetical protein [Clostridium botulinum]
MLNKTNAINNIEWKQEIINNTKNYQKENEEIIQRLVEKLKSINLLGTYIEKENIALAMENFTVEENDYNIFITGQACINADDGEDYMDNCVLGISKSGLLSWNDDLGDIELEYVDNIIVLEV